MVLRRKMHELLSMGTEVEALRFVDEPCFNDADDREDIFCVCVWSAGYLQNRFLDTSCCRVSGNGMCGGLDGCVVLMD